MIGRRAIACLALVGFLTPSAFAQVKLEYKFTEGSKTRAKTTIKSREVISIGGNDNETVAESDVTGTRSVEKHGPDGDLAVNQRLDSIQIHLATSGVEYDFDSNNPGAADANSPLKIVGDILKVLAGSSYTVVVDAKGQFKSVEGTEKVLEKAKENPQVEEAIKSRFSADFMKKEFEEEYGNLPKVLAREGESWEATESHDLGAGQTLTFRRQFEYRGTIEKNGKTLDKIAVKTLEAAYTVEPDRGLPFTAGKSELKISSTQGTILFDRELGQVVERNAEDRFAGDVAFKANDMELPGKLDITLTVKTVREPVKDSR
jgi:hypothetical protein